MTSISKVSAALAMTVLAAGSAHAAVLDLGIGGANLFSIGDFTAQGSDVEGAVLVGGNLKASNYSINNNNVDAYANSKGAGYALAVGGNLNYSSGSIKNGDIYVGGTSTTSSIGLDGSTKVSTAPVSLAAVASNAKSMSASLANVAATGSSAIQYGGMTLTGSNKSVEVFDLSGSNLSSVNYFNFTNISQNATLIINVSGSNAIGFDQNGVGLSGFAGYNVLFNFYQSTSMNIQNVGVEGSILAPLATVTGNGAQINGNVIVGSWDSNAQVNANHYFNATNVPGYTSAVPEPESYAMLLAGLGLVGWIARRRKQAA